MLLIFRLINLTPNVKVMYTILSTSVDIIRSLRPILGIMVFIYYDYALLGMEIFADRIKPDSFSYNMRFVVWFMFIQFFEMTWMFFFSFN